MRVDVVLRYIGVVMLFIAMFMLLSAGISYLSGMDSAFYPLLLSSLLTALLGAFPLCISPRTLLSIVIRIAFTPSPRSMPRGIPIKPRINPSKSTFLRICLLVAPTDASIPYILVFSVIEIAKLLRITNTLASITIIMIITARLKITVFVASFEP